MTPFKVNCYGSPRKHIQILVMGNGSVVTTKHLKKVEVAVELSNGKRLEECEVLDGEGLDYLGENEVGRVWSYAANKPRTLGAPEGGQGKIP